MAKERLEPISLHQEMQRSYLEYAMSVIVGRALPDVRDGLKPVQRRILYAMHELGLTPDRPYRKCARVVGDVLGKYHPHGDQAVYDALVRLIQDFSSRYPVLDGHGNFGSVDDDPPAAMRYTETRLSNISYEGMLEEIGSETVTFNSNFDGSQQEPTVLPAQLPFLLLNGCTGIAVGMATSIPPHNLNEIVKGLIALIKNPNLSNEKLMELIPGPDFPTGGEVLLGNGVRETYVKGKGSIPMRGKAHVEEIHPGKGKHKRTALVITELPFQLSKAGWIEKLAELVNESKVGGIADIRDESDREGMRIVVELRRDSNPENVLKELERKTPFQNNFGAILLAIVNGQPKQLGLKELLAQFLEYRELTIIKRTNYSLRKTKERLEIVEALIKALKNLKQVIEMIEQAKDVGEARITLMLNLKINEKQADAVLGMPLRKLTSLEKNSLHNEITNLKTKEHELEDLLNNRELLLKTLIEELKELKKKFGNPRRTKLIEGGDKILAEKNANQRPNVELQRKLALASLPNDGILLIQEDYQVKIISPQILGRLHLTERCDLGDHPSPARIICPINTKPKIIAVTENGRVGQIKWEFAGQNPGNVSKFLPGGLEGEKIIDLIVIPNQLEVSLGLLSSDGRFKRLPIQEILEVSGRAATIVKLKSDVKLKSAVICHPLGNLIILTDIGRIIRLMINDNTLPLMGKLAQGPQIIKLFPEEKIIKSISIIEERENSIILVEKEGRIKIININSIRLSERGSLGEMAMCSEESDEVIGIFQGSKVGSLITNLGRNARIVIKENDTQTYIDMKENELIEKVIVLYN